MMGRSNTSTEQCIGSQRKPKSAEGVCTGGECTSMVFAKGLTYRATRFRRGSECTTTRLRTLLTRSTRCQTLARVNPTMEPVINLSRTSRSVNRSIKQGRCTRTFVPGHRRHPIWKRGCWEKGGEVPRATRARSSSATAQAGLRPPRASELLRHRRIRARSGAPGAGTGIARTFGRTSRGGIRIREGRAVRPYISKKLWSGPCGRVSIGMG